jgi:hypothetical protein
MRRIALVVALSMVTMLTFGSAAEATHEVTHIPIGGTSQDGTFQGTFDLQRFVFRNGQIFAVGTLTGTLTDAAGAVTNVGPTQVRLPVTVAQATCTILTLDLGPLDLNLLGLHIHLDEVHLVIEAHEGQGLLGDLLCAIANALNQGGTLRGVTALLNQVLRALG